MPLDLNATLTTEIAKDETKPVFLYEFVVSGTTVRFCQSDVNIVFGGNTYTACAISHEAIKQDTETRAAETKVTIENVSRTFSNYLVNNVDLRMGTCTIKQVFRNLLSDSDNYVVLFSGYMDSPEISTTKCSVTVKSKIGELSRTVPYANYSATCRYRFNSTYCKGYSFNWVQDGGFEVWQRRRAGKQPFYAWISSSGSENDSHRSGTPAIRVGSPGIVAGKIMNSGTHSFYQKLTLPITGYYFQVSGYAYIVSRTDGTASLRLYNATDGNWLSATTQTTGSWVALTATEGQPTVADNYIYCEKTTETGNGKVYLFDDIELIGAHEYRIITGINNTIKFISDQSSPSTVTITLTGATYSPNGMATHLATQMNANATLTGTGTITFAVAFSYSTRKFTIDATAGHTIDYVDSGSTAGDILGFTADTVAAQTITSDTAQPTIGNVDSSGTATGGSTTTVIDTTNRSEPDDYWNHGFITMTSGSASGQTRRIGDFVNSTNTITVDYAFTAAVANTDTYTIKRNCDYQYLTCDTMFCNRGNFGGFIGVPTHP